LVAIRASHKALPRKDRRSAPAEEAEEEEEVKKSHLRYLAKKVHDDKVKSYFQGKYVGVPPTEQREPDGSLSLNTPEVAKAAIDELAWEHYEKYVPGGKELADAVKHVAKMALEETDALRAAEIVEKIQKFSIEIAKVVGAIKAKKAEKPAQTNVAVRLDTTGFNPDSPAARRVLDHAPRKTEPAKTASLPAPAGIDAMSRPASGQASQQTARD
jgi:hypothetical protein